MNFTSIQMKPLRYCSLSRLKEAVNAKTKDVATEETPAKMRKLDEESGPPPGLLSLDGLIVVSKKPDTIAKELVKLVAPSGNFAIYSPYLEVVYKEVLNAFYITFIFFSKPMSETYAQLRDADYAINLKLVEAWLRNYQVLPHRTHPEVMMSGTGGYILSGIRVVA